MHRTGQVSDGYEYEQFVAHELQKRGFRNLQHTAKTGDYGVDLLAEYAGHRYAVQCKYYTDAVGGFAVQEAVAGMAYYNCERAMVVTNTRLTKAAAELAEANKVMVLEGIDPDHLSFWARRRPWELVLFALQCVVFGLVLDQMIHQQTMNWQAVAVLVLLCFPLPFLLLYLIRIILKLTG